MKYIIAIFFLLITIVDAAELTVAQKRKLVHAVRWLAGFNIRYGKNTALKAGGERRRWDCSGTAQYLYKITFQKSIPRTSYDQFKELQKQGKIKSPEWQNGRIDTGKLKKQLKTGDLLFWTNTHDAIPSFRDPPIGHVMIYLGTTRAGKMMMGGSNTWGSGYVNKRPGGGPDIYVFDPNLRMGCAKWNIPGNRKSGCSKGFESKFYGFGQP